MKVVNWVFEVFLVMSRFPLETPTINSISQMALVI